MQTYYPPATLRRKEEVMTHRGGTAQPRKPQHDNGLHNRAQDNRVKRDKAQRKNGGK